MNGSNDLGQVFLVTVSGKFSLGPIDACWAPEKKNLPGICSGAEG